MYRIASAASVGVLAAVVTIGCHRPTPPPPDTGPVAVTVAKPLARQVTAYTDLTGNLQAVQSVDVRPRVSGYIEKVNFTDGSDVKEGDVLVEIDPRMYQAEVKQAEAQLEVYKEQLKLAEADYKRFEKLIKTGSIAQEEFDKAAAQVGVQKANIDLGRANIDQAQLNLDWCKVTAPISGKVDRIRLTKGNVATGGTAQGTVLTTIKSEDPIYVYVDVDEQRVVDYLKAKAAAGDTKIGGADAAPVEIRLPGETGYPHKGTIDFNSNAVEAQTGTMELRAVFANPGPVRVMVPGVYVEARIPSRDSGEALLIPDDAVMADQADKTVYVVTADNKVRTRKVTLGPRALGLRIVADGLKPDDRVMIRGLQRVVDGQPVAPQAGTITAVGESDAAPTAK